MKNMKKLAGLVLALVLVLAFVIDTTVMAISGTNDNTGTITVSNPVADQTYTIYQILVLESYDTEAEAYSYTVAAGWEDFVANATKYLSVDDNGYVTWIEDADTDTDVATFAKEALAYAKENKINNQGSVTATEDDTTLVFEQLNLGYYLVDTSLGALCSLSTTQPNATVTEKNEEPTIEKEVQEDSDLKWYKENTAEIGDTVYFKTTITAKAGAQNYVVHDKMSEGLTLNQKSIEVTVGDNTLTKGQDYTVAYNVEHTNQNSEVEYTCAFEITFAKTYLDTITKDTTIVVTYSAILNEKAVISTDANTNDTKLTYGDSSETVWKHTDTYTFQFDLVKTDSDKKVITGAKFELYDADKGGNKIALVKEADGVYRIATDAEIVGGFESAVIEAGSVTIKGLDADTSYWLQETKAPDGYNKLATRIEVKMKESNLTANILDGVYVNGGVQIVNLAGTELPSTGGNGTTIFYVLGGILVLGATVLLVTKKRMSNSE